MLSLVTSIRTIRVSRLRMKNVVNHDDWSSQVIPMTYCMATEIEAAIKGEPYTYELIHRVTNPNDFFSFICSDRKVTLSYNKHTLARHSLLIRGFIEDYPDLYEIDISTHHSTSLTSAFRCILMAQMEDLTPEVLSVLRLLTPPTDLYYFLFELPSTIDPSFVITLLRGITDDERVQVLHSHRLMSNHQGEYGEVPNGGKDLAIGFAFATVRDYLKEVRVPEFYNVYPSFITYLLLDHEEDLSKLKEIIFSSDFTDDCGILTDGYSRSTTIDALFVLMTRVEWQQAVIILTMLGVRHPSLGNENEERMGPFQLTLQQYTMSRSVWEIVSVYLSNVGNIPMNVVESLFARCVD